MSAVTSRCAIPFWPYIKRRRPQDAGENLAPYLNAVRQLLAARRCVNSTFNPADERLATQLFRERIDTKQIERAVLLGCARRYVALLNGTTVGPISALSYFSSVIQEAGALQVSEDYWRYVALKVAKVQWTGA
jgi:hypothetical protein